MSQLTAKSSIEDLLTAIRSFEEREQCDVKIVFFGDGSGEVWAPELFTKPGEEPGGWEEVQLFDNVEDLGAWLESGHVEEAELRGAGI